MSDFQNPYIEEILQYDDLVWLEINKNALNLEDFLNNSEKVIMDIGCGAGNFIRDCAKVEPSIGFVGIDLRYKRLVRAAQKFRKQGLVNARLIRTSANEITQWFPEESVNRVHMNFPDPWPKRKHHKHRMVQADFMKNLYRILVPGGVFVLKTDHLELYRWVKDVMKDLSIYQEVNQSCDLHNSPMQEQNIMTEFEQLFKNQSLPVYYIEYKRVSHP